MIAIIAPRSNDYNKIIEIEKSLKEEHAAYYGKSCGYKQLMTPVGYQVCGYQVTDHGFRWLRSSGTYIEFYKNGSIFVCGARHSIDEFLGQFFTKEELLDSVQEYINSSQPERPVGDTLR